MAQHVVVTDYNPKWPDFYQKEAAAIAALLGDEISAIYHIGSTSVKGLKAKPIIDIMPVVKSIDRVDRFFPEFQRLGYECLGEFGIPGRRYFRKGGDFRTHQIHIFQTDNRWDILRHLAVRDYLRTHPQVAAAYGELKARLAKQYPEDIEKYCDGKDAFVKQLEQDALAWYPSAPK